VGDEVAGMVDLALWLRQQPLTVIEDNQSVRKIVRLIQTFTDSAHPWVKDRSGKLPQEFEVDFKTDFNRMNDLIFGDIPDDIPSTPVEEEAAPTAADPVVVPETAPTDVQESVAEVGNTAPEPQAEPAPEPAEAEAPAGVDASTGEIVGFTCESCSSVFDSEDQRDLSKIKYRKVLCAACYRDQGKKKTNG
jgi:hypothetical protein